MPLDRAAPRIFVAGPYTKGDVAVNVRRAFEAADELANQGFAAYVPHSTHFWHMLFPRPYEDWLELALAFIPMCDGLLRLPGDSHGADGEVAEAKKRGIPVFYEISEVVTHFES